MDLANDMQAQQPAENLMFQTEGEDDLRELLRKLNRRRSVIFSVFILVLALSLLYMSQQPRLYTASSLLALDTRKSNVVDVEAVLSGLPMNAWAIESEMDIIRSRPFLERVVDKLNLTQDPLFNPDLRDKPKKGTFSAMIDWITSLWASKSVAEVPVDPGDHAARLRRMISDTLAGGLKVENIRNSYTIKLTYTFSDPRMTAEVVNAVADAYLTDQLETKFDATRRANEWLAERLNKLRQEVHAAELAVQKVKEKGNLVKAKGSTLLEQQIAELNAQLVMARVSRSQAEARLKWVRDHISTEKGLESVDEVMASPEVQRLRTEEAQLLHKQAEMSSRYGPKHPEMLKITAELNDVRAKIKQESNRVVDSLANQVEVSKAKEKALMASLDELHNQISVSLKTEVELGELERQAEVSKTLYENFLSRFHETSDQASLNQPDARVIDYAETPTFPSHPNKRFILGFGGIIGLALGLMCAFLLEILDRGFRQSEQVELATGLSVLGMTPTLGKGRGTPVDYVVKNPLSQMAEAMRAVRAAIQLSNVDKPPKAVLVTSALPSEGKTTFCATLGRVAALAGSKILLIDGDMRRPSLDKMLGVNPEARLEEVLAGEKKFEEAIVEDSKSGLHVICSRGHSANAVDLLGSQRMGNLIKEAAKSYELVIIDTPPLMGVSDSWGLTQSVDEVIFLIRWAETPRETVRAALRRMELLNVRTKGIVLAQVDIRQQARYGYGDYGYYYKRYKSYYND